MEDAEFIDKLMTKIYSKYPNFSEKAIKQKKKESSLQTYNPNEFKKTLKKY